ncbi:MAG: methyl-accepting chemotaxis protein [Oceanicaulis sp.]|nr:methyl-accepting chemotaxis protein [Oceanicaulis sp.]
MATAIAGAITAALAWPVIQRMFKPMLDLAQRMDAVAQGDRSADDAFEGRADEIGRIAKALNHMTDSCMQRKPPRRANCRARSKKRKRHRLCRLKSRRSRPARVRPCAPLKLCLSKS